MSILVQGGGLVVTLGPEPVHQADHDLPLIFDWTLLEGLDECNSRDFAGWPNTQGVPVVAVGLPRWREKIPETRRPLLGRVVHQGNVEIIQVRTGLSVGGVLRERQAEAGDILLTLGGGPGVEHLAELYMETRKPVIPLDVPIKANTESASEKLSTLAMENTERFFEYRPREKAAAAYSSLSMKNELLDANGFSKRCLEFMSHIARPKAFFARLLDSDLPEFADIEAFFRGVVDPVIDEAGYERFEMGSEASREPFLNLEIFNTLRCSSLAIVDLTGLRPNCFTELGYALGLRKKVIVTARKGTRLPFDTSALPCHFWSSNLRDESRREKLRDFIMKNIDRKRIGS